MEVVIMPGGDRTGPSGQGAATGRGLGPCGAGGRVFGRGSFGRGFRGMAQVQPIYDQTAQVELSKDEKLKILEADKADIEAELKEIEKAIELLKN